MSKPSTWHSIVGIGFAVAGVSKLVSARPQVELFESWGWPKESMQVIGAAELFGAALLLTGRTRRLGALVLTATSGCVLQHEIEHGDDELVTPRAGMLLAAVSGFFGGGRSQGRQAVGSMADHLGDGAAVAARAAGSGLHDAAGATSTWTRGLQQQAETVADKARQAAGVAASKVADAALGTGAALAQKTGTLAADYARQAGAATAKGAGRLAARGGEAAGRQVRIWGRKAARQAGKAGDAAVDYARHAAEQASDRAKDLARSKGWA